MRKSDIIPGKDSISKEAIHPLEKIHFPDEDLADLKRRIQATRWPDKETVEDNSQGVRLAKMQALAKYWATDYDWRKIEAKLNALPNFMTTIDGLDIHFIHVKSKHPNALPVIITHGWPGSIIEQLKLIGPLTDPTAHGGKAEDAFDVVIPSLPGYGFSGKPTTTGWGPEKIASAWITLMKRLGYKKFVAQGGDWGALVTDSMALQAPPELIGMHTNLPRVIPPDIANLILSGQPAPASLSADEKKTFEQLGGFFAKHAFYALYLGTRPQTLYGLNDSPIALAAFLIDHGDSAGQPGTIEAVLEGGKMGDVTRDDLLDNATLYWLTNTGVSAGRIYWENKLSFIAASGISVPAAVSVFPNELFTPPRSWAEKAYTKLIHYNKVERGGHYAAWEQPQLMTEELRTAFRSLR